MNKIYKVIWSKVRNCYVAVSEIAKRNGKSCTSVNCGAKANLGNAGMALSAAVGATLLAGVCSVLLPVRVALAAPVMPTLDVNGKSAAVTIASTPSGASATMNIKSTQTNNVLKWIDFSIGQGGTVQFDPNNYLNYVTGHGRSEIDGTLTGAGNIYIVNPNGVLFGDNARVDVGSLYVSTRELGADQFSAFEGGNNPLTAGDIKGDVVNLGKLNATNITVEGNNISFKNVADVTKGGALTDGDITGGTAHNDSSVTLTANSTGEIHIGSSDGRTPAYSMSGTDSKFMYKLVSTAAELQAIGEETNLSGNYMLANDIDLKNGDDYILFKPIGYTKRYLQPNNHYATEDLVFTGRFDGLNYKIKNLKITDDTLLSFANDNDTVSHNIGLFGINQGTIENVAVEDTEIEVSTNTVGGIAGWNNNGGTIRNVYHTGKVTGKASVGGIAGANQNGSLIETAYNTGEVAGTFIVGGIAGNNVGTFYGTPTGNVKVFSRIKNVYNTGAVTGTTGASGGIAGNTSSNIKIENAYNTGAIKSGDNKSGGIVGNVSFDNNYGIAEAKIMNTYNTGTVTNGDNTTGGGIIGYKGSNGSLEVTSSYYSQGTDGNGGTPKTETELKQLSTFSGWDISATGGAKTTWRISEGQTTPQLTALLKTKDYINKKTYDGTADVSTTKSDGTTHQAEGLEQGFDYVQDVSVIEPKELTVTFADISKTYDGTTSATPGGGTLSGGIISGDDVMLDTTGIVAVYADKNAGIGNKTVNYSGIALTGTKAGNYSILDTAQNTTSTIDPKELTVTFANISKTYDGNTTATPGVGTLSTADVISGDTVTLDTTNISAAYADKNAGTGNKTVNYSGIALTGTDAGNYSIAETAQNTTSTIDPKKLTVTFAEISKTYDGTQEDRDSDGNAVESRTASGVDGVVAGETISVTGKATYSTASADDVNSQTVNYSELTPTGTTASNYTVTVPEGGMTGSGKIFRKELTVGNVTKEYDGTEDATITKEQLIGLVNSDTDSISISSGVTATYISDDASVNPADAGTGKKVDYSGLTLSGSAAGNYKIVASGTSTTNNSITPKVLTASSVSKVYDGTDTATLHLSDLLGTDGLPGVVERDETYLNLTTSAATYGNKNAGIYDNVTFNGISLTGDKAHNYTINDSITVSGTITRKALELVADKVTIHENDAMPSSFTGSIIGFIAGEGLANNDTLGFSLANPMTTPVVGSYSIIGKLIIGGTLPGAESGDYGSNYTFQNAASNATAFTVKPILAVLPALDFRGASVNVTIDKSVENVLSIDSTKLYNTLKWIDFSIGETGTVRFDDKNYLNYVTGHGRSDIDGTITGGGDIYLINPNGVLFGSTAQVDVGNLYVSSRTLDSTALNAFETDGTNPLATSPISAIGNIINRGTLTAAGITVEGNNVSFKNYADVTATGAEGIKVRADGEVHVGFANGEEATAVNNTEYKTVSEPELANWDFKKTDNTTEVTPEKYMLVRNAFELQNMKNNLLGNYMLANDIEFKNAGGYIIGQFIPIGSLGGWTDYREGMFKGKLDGLYHVIRDIYIDNTAITQNSNRLTDIGIIGSNAGTVENLGVINGNVNITNSGASAVGGIVGANKPGGILRNVYFSGSVKGGGSGTGGVAGWQNIGGVTENAYATGTVTSSSNYPDRINGVIGVTGGSIKNAYFSGKVRNNNMNELYKSDGTRQTLTNTYMMKQFATFNSDGANWDITADGSKNATWRIYEGKTTPLLTAFLKTKSLVTETEYDGTEQAFDQTLVTGNSHVIELDSAAYSAKGTNAGVYDETKKFYSDSQQGYNIVDTKLVIQPKKLRLDNTKVYDGTTSATASAIGLKSSDIIGNDVVTLADGSVTGGLYADKKAGVNKAVTYTIADSTLGGTNAANYILTVKGTGTITPKAITATFADISKDYDGSVAATENGKQLNDVVSGDDVDFATGITGAFADKNVGTDKTVTYSGISLTGTDKDNYSIAASATGKGTITPKAITATFGDISRDYDGSVTATENGKQLNDVVSGDDVDFATGITGAFADKNVGTDKTVTYSGISLTGNDKDNYSIAVSATGKGTITAKAITATFDDISRVYDGSVTATENGKQLNDVVSGDDVDFATGITGAFADKNVGTDKTVTYSGIALTGTDKNNYSIAASATGKGTITPKAITAIFADISKVYDGTTNATAGAGTLSGVESIDSGKVSVSANAAYDQKNAGSRTVNYTGVALSGAEANNYSIETTATGAGTITPKELTATFADISKIYDGTTNAIPGAGTLTGVIAADEGKVSVSAAAAYDEKNAGSRIVNYTGVTLSGAEANNYSVAATATGKGKIGRKALELVADPASTQEGDYNPATFTGRVTGFVTGEGIENGDTLRFALSDPSVSAVGSYAVIGTINGKASGNYGLNYSFTNAASNANAFEITARPASVQDMVLSDIIPGIKGKTGADISVTALDNAMEQARDKRAELGIEFAVAQTILSVDAEKTLSMENRGMKQPPSMTPQEVAEQVHAQQGNGYGVAAQADGNAGAVNAAMDMVQKTDNTVGTEESKRKKGVA